MASSGTGPNPDGRSPMTRSGAGRRPARVGGGVVRRTPRRGGRGVAIRSSLLAGLIGVALIVSGILAYQAHDAASSHQEVARQAVSDLAAAAAWQFTERGQLRFGDLVNESLAMPARRAAAQSGSPPSLQSFLSASGDWNECRCVQMDRPSTFFRLPVETGGEGIDTGPLEVEGIPLDDPVRDWLSRSVAEAAAEAAGGTSSTRHPGGGVLFRVDGDEAEAFLYYIFQSGTEDLVVFGYRVDGRMVTEAVLKPVLAAAPLLPEPLTGGWPADSLFRLEAGPPGGPALFATAGPEDTGKFLGGSNRFADWAGGMEVTVSVPEERAEALVIGGLPASRLPLILILLTLTGALLFAAVLVLRQQHRLARMRSDFVAGVTHELRTPLAQIRMFAELLSLEKLSSMEERSRALHVIDEESRRLDHLIDNVLGFARMGVADRPVEMRPVELEHLLPDVVERFRPLARERNAFLDLEVEEGVLAWADRDAVHRILLNLLDNAVKYGPRGQRVRVQARSEEGWARIQVDDEGPGVPPRHRHRIWDPYERLEVGGDGGVSGSGIGLAVVQGLVEGHGGRTMVEDAPGGGARFVVLLPLAMATDETRVGSRPRSGGSRGVGAGGPEVDPGASGATETVEEPLEPTVSIAED
jgi:signal transduction histidine kinase